jgi:hypothetical protein
MIDLISNRLEFFLIASEMGITKAAFYYIESKHDLFSEICHSAITCLIEGVCEIKRVSGTSRRGWSGSSAGTLGHAVAESSCVGCLPKQ